MTMATPRIDLSLPVSKFLEEQDDGVHREGTPLPESIFTRGHHGAGLLKVRGRSDPQTLPRSPEPVTLVPHALVLIADLPQRIDAS